MLQEIQIYNLALIEKLDLSLHSGFTTLTGETGAGKSILLDALGLVLGDRADSGLVRHGEQRAEVCASFDISQQPQAQAWLKQQALNDEEPICLLRRVVNADGRSKAYINGRPVPAHNLKSLGDLLVDIHGQHEHQSLLAAGHQMSLLDAYGSLTSQLEPLKTAFQHWKKRRQHYQDLQANQVEHQSKLELLAFQLSEFDRIAPQSDEYETLSEQQSALAHANEIKQAGYQAYDALESEQGASACLTQAIQKLEQLQSLTTSLSMPLEQLNSALIEIQEAANDIQHISEGVELDPQKLEDVELRLSELYALAKKYHISPEELVNKHQQLKTDYEQLNHDFGSLDELAQEIDQAWQDFSALAQKISQKRQAQAKKLSKTVTASMQELGMAKGFFEVRVTPSEKPGELGCDQVVFFVAANPGQPAKPLAKVASGGELSRISLAIQVACAQVARTPTLIFDEVDVGIGGGTAEVVGQKMQKLAQHCQVLSVTHLGQVAAYGHQHLSIAKHTQQGKTTTQVKPLDTTQRIEEIARMVGGLEISEQTRKHAQELYQRASKNLL